MIYSGSQIEFYIQLYLGSQVKQVTIYIFTLTTCYSRETTKESLAISPST